LVLVDIKKGFLMKSVWVQNDVENTLGRLNKLTAASQPLWGKMSVGQMLAHCNITYELVYETIHPKPNFLVKTLLKLFVKNTVINDKPYKHNSPTGGVFIIKETNDFEKEKTRLIEYINKTLQVGEKYFEGRASHSFGPLNTNEWNNMFYKHLDHHFSQFGV